MSIRTVTSLRRADPPGESPRIYVNGLAARPAVVWAAPLGDDRFLVHVRNAGPDLTEDAIRAAVARQRPGADRSWAALAAAAAEPGQKTARVKLEADSGEPTELLETLRKSPRIELATARLGAGAYRVRGLLTLRRTSVAEMAAGLTTPTGRSAGRVVIVMETYGEKVEQAVWGRAGEECCRLAVAEGVPTLQSRSRASTVAMIRDCAHVAAEVAADEETPERTDLPVQVLSRIPGVSARMATDMLRRFGSVQGICRATRDEMQEIAGIGERTADTIGAALRGSLAPD